MSDYPPPRENVPIFDSTLFGSRTPDVGGGGLTEADMDQLYLKWSNGQSSGETFNSTTTVSSTLSITGATGLQSTSVTGDITAQQDVILTNVGSYLQFPDATQQVSAFAPIVPFSPAGVYTNANITVNAYGQVTSAFSGGGGGTTIAQTVIRGSLLITPTDIVVPAGAKLMQIILCSGGGEQGLNFTSGNLMYAGGSGAAGSMAILYFDITPPPYSFTGNLLKYTFGPSAEQGQGIGVTLEWTDAAVAYYGAILPSYTNAGGGGNTICALQGGIAGLDGTSLAAGAGGTNPDISLQIAMSSPGNGLYTQYAQGQNGARTPIFDYTTNTVAQSRPSNPMGDFNYLRPILNQFMNGEYSTYAPSGITQTPAGASGVVLTFFG